MKFDIYKSESKRPKTYIVTFEPDNNSYMRTSLKLRIYAKKFFRASEKDIATQRGYFSRMSSILSLLKARRSASWLTTIRGAHEVR